MGGVNSGKTPCLLSAVLKGYKVFGTELTHVKIENSGYTFFKAAVVDNIRPGHIISYFPELIRKLSITNIHEVPDQWKIKVPIDFGKVEYPELTVQNPYVEFIMPRIEEGRNEVITEEVGSKDSLAKELFDRSSEKIGTTSLLYNSYPASGLDCQASAIRRFDAIMQMLNVFKIDRATHFISSSQNCKELF